MKKIRMFIQKAWGKLFPSSTFNTNICNHETRLTGRIGPPEEGAKITLLLSDNGKPDYCIQCIEKMSIRCAWCGESIHIGEPVTLMAPHTKYKIPDYAVRYDKNPKFLVGCLRWDCAPTGALRSGFWQPPGKVHRVPSPLEIAFRTGNMVIVSDLSDQKNLGTVHSIP